MESPLPDEAARAVTSYLRAADRMLPRGVVAAALAGSLALGAYRRAASDIDMIAVLADEWRGRRDLLPRLRGLHLSQLPRLFGRAARGRGITACCNTAFVWDSEVSLPVTHIEPVASHNGEIFDSRGAFDVNPVIWHQLSEGGIPIRGGPIATWNLDPEPAALQDWTRQNLHDYWWPLAERLASGDRPLRAGHVEWCLLGPARMHATLKTGEVISKDEAGRRALETFPEHAPILRVALARIRRSAVPSTPPHGEWRIRTVDAMRSIMAGVAGRGRD